MEQVTKKTEEAKVETKKAEVNLKMVEVPMYDEYAVAMGKNDGKFLAIKFPYNSVTLEAGKGQVIETNTDPFIIQERVQILIFENDKIDL